MDPNSPQQQIPFLESINSLWGLVSGVIIGLWTSVRIIWNIGKYFRGIDRRFDKLETEIERLHLAIRELWTGDKDAIL